jgi:hypothetical protein
MVGMSVAGLLIGEQCGGGGVLFLKEVWSAMEAGASEREYWLIGSFGFDG